MRRRRQRAVFLGANFTPRRNNATFAMQNFPVGANFFRRRQLRFKKLASAAIACARIRRSPRLKGGGHKKNNRKKWRAKED
jgi:hypothetical protein